VTDRDRLSPSTFSLLFPSFTHRHHDDRTEAAGSMEQGAMTAMTGMKTFLLLLLFPLKNHHHHAYLLLLDRHHLISGSDASSQLFILS
jgi:hypothetical protein